MLAVRRFVTLCAMFSKHFTPFIVQLTRTIDGARHGLSAAGGALGDEEVDGASWSSASLQLESAVRDRLAGITSKIRAATSVS